jgi:aconitate hydratase
MVAMPGSPDNVKPVKEVVGTKLQQVHIGSCTNGSWRDLYIASRMLEEKQVNPDCEVMVVPGSRQVLQMLMKDGSFERFINAGCRIMEPGCGPCIGMGFVPGAGHLSLRSVNRNWFGRGGNKLARLALSSVEVCAASALAGKIADPRGLDPVDVPEPKYIIDDVLLMKPKGPATEIVRSKNIVPLKPQTPLPDHLECEVLLTVGDGISTDDILPAGPLTQHLRSNLPEIAKFVYYYQDDTFARRAKEAGKSFIVGGENYGQGSSREHAALAPKELGITAVFAKSFARIHRKNLINCGIVPILCDTDGIDQGDKIEVNLKDLESGSISAKNITKNQALPVRIDMSEREINMLKAGGILAYTKASQ